MLPGCRRKFHALKSGMSLKELKDGALVLDAESRHELMAFLQTLEDDADEAYRRELARKIDDKNPANWISLEDAKARLLPDD